MSQEQQTITRLIKAGQSDKIVAPGQQFELLSVFPFGFPVRLRPANGVWDIYFPGSGAVEAKPFTQLEIANDVFPAAAQRDLTVRVRITPERKISDVVRTRDLEIVSYGFGIENILAGAQLTFDAFALAPSLLALYPPDWRLMHARTTFTLLTATAQVFVLGGGSVGFNLVQNVPLVYRGTAMPVVFNNDVGAVNVTAMQEFYLLP